VHAESITPKRVGLMGGVRESFGFPLLLAHRTDVGRVRDNNEDAHGSAWLDDGSLFVIVADGMGGHDAGEVASGLAVQVVEEAVARDIAVDPRERLYHALLEANEAILDEGARSGTRGMGTTSITVICKGSEIYVGQIGDSRAYQFRNGQMVWRTSDHTRVQMLIDQGQITEEESRVHPEAGMLTRALGHSRMADGRPLVPDVLNEPVHLQTNDTLVMCSDGLHDLLEDWEIGQAISDKTPDEAAAVLVEMACERGGHDNVTVAIIQAGTRTSPYDAEYQPATWSNDETDDNITYDDPHDKGGSRNPVGDMYQADALVPENTDDEPIPVVNAGIQVGQVSGPAPGMATGEPAAGGNKVIMIGAMVVLVLVVLVTVVVGAIIAAAVVMNM
jgi:protein phosphatase